MTIYHSRGSSYPLGPSFYADHINLAVYCPAPTALHLQVGSEEIPLHRTRDYCHVALRPEALGQRYAYFAHKQRLIDPYARVLDSSRAWGSGQSQPWALLLEPENFDWQGVKAPNLPQKSLCIYELHVRAFTRGGGFLDVIDRLPYLRSLGVNAIELLPVCEFNEREAEPWNMWGYSPLHFFAPMGRYAKGADPGAPIREFQTLVREAHRTGIEVIVDVVLNHTAERDRSCPTSSLRGLAEATYYHLTEQGELANYSGCGNALNATHPVCAQLLLDALRFWAKDLGVDAFRFDLSSILTRGPDGAPLTQPPFLERLENDPILSRCKLIAEPWDAGGLYQQGLFAARGAWSEWNDRFRDDVRRFLRGDGMAAALASRLAGSADLYADRSPLASINYITAHDGFSLADLVSYNKKHNAANGEEGRDGCGENFSWNCGAEGPSECPELAQVRKSQQRNFLLALCVAQGIPMLRMGDECGLTQAGNNNSWCHDELNWLPEAGDEELKQYLSSLLELRHRHPLLGQARFLTAEDVTWHLPDASPHDWQQDRHFLGMWLHGRGAADDLYVAFNASAEAKEIRVPWTQAKQASKQMLGAWSSLLIENKLAPEPSTTEACATQGPATKS